MLGLEASLAHAREKFNALVRYVLQEAQGHDAYTVEVRIFRELLLLGLRLLAAWFVKKLGGDVGEAIVTESGQVLPRERPKDRRYLTVFGELVLPRWYYHADGWPGVFPLDEEVNLPRRTYSYFVQELFGQWEARMTYEEAMAEMEGLFGLRLDKHTVENMAPEMARDVEAYYEALGTPPPQSEAEVLVVAIDGKGVPVLKDQPAERKVRLGRGEKRSRKKEAVVSAVYTIAPQPRTAEEIVREVRDRHTPPQRPKPQNKHVHATMQGKTHALEWVRREVERRDPKGQKRRVCLMDGARGLQRLAVGALAGFTFILDLFHALEYLWKAAYVFHPEGSPQAEDFVRCRLLKLLEGNVGYLIGGLRQMLSKHTLNSKQRQTLQKVIGYYQANRDWMHYHDYIAAGYPIGSGAVEGACRHLVKDRMEGSGMRWTVAGAEAVLRLRAVYLNGDWEAFWSFHMHKEAQRRFGTRTWAPLVGDTPQKAVA